MLSVYGGKGNGTIAQATIAKFFHDLREHGDWLHITINVVRKMAPKATNTKIQVEKGDAIRFIAGKYAGKKGWKNNAELEYEHFVPVVVSHGGKFYPTFVHKGSIKVETSEVPKGYAQQVLKECPDIEMAMVSTNTFRKQLIGKKQWDRKHTTVRLKQETQEAKG